MSTMTLALQTVPVEDAVYIPDTFLRTSVSRYHKMIEAGIITPEDDVELLEGWVIHKMGKNRAHTKANHLVRKALERIVTGDFYIEAQEPVTLLDSEPEPDVMVVRGDLFDYDNQPQAADVPLLVEISDATLLRDQGWKRRIYARSGILVYWIVNLQASQIEVHSNPTGNVTHPDYLQRQTYHFGDDVPVVIDGVTVGSLTVSDLLP